MGDEDYEVLPVKELSSMKEDLDNRSKRDVSSKDVNESVQKLSRIISQMLEVFSAAAEQMKLEDKEYEISSKKHDQILSKLDKLIDQNRTIAEGMVSIVEMVKENKSDIPKPMRETPKMDPRPMPMQPPQSQFMQQQMSMPQMPSMSAMPSMPQMQAMPQMPSMQTMNIPAPSPISIPGTILQSPAGPTEDPDLNSPPPGFEDLDIPEPPSPTDLDFPDIEVEEPKKKGLMGMFKK